jgi:hypothetical protein
VDSLTKKEKLDEELKPFPPYCKYIDGQIEELNKEVEKNIKRRDEEYEIWVNSMRKFPEIQLLMMFRLENRNIPRLLLPRV